MNKNAIYGSKLRDKLLKLDLIKESSDNWLNCDKEELETQEIKIEGKIQFGNKRSAIEMISQLREQFDISIDEIERFSF